MLIFAAVGLQIRPNAEALHVARCAGVYQGAGGVEDEDVLHVAIYCGLAQCGDEVDVGVDCAAEGIGTKKFGDEAYESAPSLLITTMHFAELRPL